MENKRGKKGKIEKSDNKIIPENDCELDTDNIEFKTFYNTLLHLSSQLEDLGTQSSILTELYENQLAANKKLQLKCEALENEKIALVNEKTALVNEKSALEGRLLIMEKELLTTKNDLLKAVNEKRKTDLQYRQNMNPIYCNEIQQNSGIPMYTIIDERSYQYQTEITVQCSWGRYVSYGCGLDFETAKYYATQAMHQVVNYSNLAFPPSCIPFKSQGVELKNQRQEEFLFKNQRKQKKKSKKRKQRKQQNVQSDDKIKKEEK